MKLPVRSNAATFPCRKALIVSVALAACLSTSAATVESVPKDAIRTSRAVDELNSTYTPVSVQRFLKSTRDDVITAEERTDIEGVTILKSIFEKGMKWLAPRSERVLQKQSEVEFSRLGLNNGYAIDLSKVEDFHTWIAYVVNVFNILGLTEKTKLFDSPLGNIWLDYLYLLEKESDSKVLKILQTMFGDAVIAKMLYDSASVDVRAEKLQEAQYKKWHDGDVNIPLDMADGNNDLLLKMTASYFEWIKAQKPEV